MIGIILEPPGHEHAYNELDRGARSPVGLQHARVSEVARSGGVLGVAVARLVDGGDVSAAARACYAGGSGAGLAVVHRGPGDLVLIQVGKEADARRNLSAASSALQQAVRVRGIGIAVSTQLRREDLSNADARPGTRLVTLATDALFEHSPEPGTPA